MESFSKSFLLAYLYTKKDWYVVPVTPLTVPVRIANSSMFAMCFCLLCLISWYTTTSLNQSHKVEFEFTNFELLKSKGRRAHLLTNLYSQLALPEVAKRSSRSLPDHAGNPRAQNQDLRVPWDRWRRREQAGEEDKGTVCHLTRHITYVFEFVTNPDLLGVLL